MSKDDRNAARKIVRERALAQIESVTRDGAALAITTTRPLEGDMRADMIKTVQAIIKKNSPNDADLYAVIEAPTQNSNPNIVRAQITWLNAPSFPDGTLAWIMAEVTALKGKEHAL